MYKNTRKYISVGKNNLSLLKVEKNLQILFYLVQNATFKILEKPESCYLSIKSYISLFYTLLFLSQCSQRSRSKDCICSLSVSSGVEYISHQVNATYFYTTAAITRSNSGACMFLEQR